MDAAVVLEEVEMAPRFLSEVVRRAEPAAGRAGAAGAAAIGVHLQMKLARGLVDLQSLRCQLPRRLDTKAQQENVVTVHLRSFCDQFIPLRCYGNPGRFHLKPRRAC